MKFIIALLMLLGFAEMQNRRGGGRSGTGSNSCDIEVDLDGTSYSLINTDTNGYTQCIKPCVYAPKNKQLERCCFTKPNKIECLKLKATRLAPPDGVPGCCQCPPSAPSSTPCFASNSMVETHSGHKEMSEIVLGESLATYSPLNGKVFTKFLGWLDRGSETARFRKVETASGKKMTLTDSHITFVRLDGELVPKYAKELTMTDKLLFWNGETFEETEISSLNYEVSQGWRTPLTETGTLLVDGILCSCYASFDHNLSDIAFAPIKAFPFLLEDTKSQHKDGVRFVVKKLKQLGTLLGFRRNVPAEEKNQSFPTLPGISMMISPGKGEL